MDCRLEICCADIESVINARKGGADRIELCMALELGGLTPSIGLIERAVEIMGAGNVHVLIRPRPGDFVYSEEEALVMEKDISMAVAAGAAGVVVGALTPEGRIDLSLSRRLRESFPSTKFTFHRAFDFVEEPYEALESIIDMGYDYLLTSGLSASALEGAPLIASLVSGSSGRIRIMAGAGVSPDNVDEIIRKTGVRDIHASAKSRVECMHRNRDVSTGGMSEADDCRLVTSQGIVSRLKNIISTY